MAERRNQHDVRILRINENAPNMLRITQANIGPRLSTVGGFVNTIAVGEIRTQVSFAGAHINDVGVRWSERNCANRSNRLTVKNRFPRFSAVRGLPYAAANRAQVINVRLSFNSAYGNTASAAEGANTAPAQAAIDRGTSLLCGRGEQKSEQ